MMKVDLHIHSIYSDGVYAPSELVKMAASRGVSVISIVDHDCVNAVGEVEGAARENGVEVVAGVELSSEFRGRDLHVLGYGFDPGDEALLGMLERFRETRHRRGLKIVENLKDMGVHLEPEEVLAKSPDGSLGRPHIAEAMIEKGYVSNHFEAFSRYLGEHCPSYVKKYKLGPGEAIHYIRSSGGLAFIAHPGNYLEDEEGLFELIDYGFDGIEIIHPNHGGNETVQLKMIAGKYGLLMSGGSDYHGFAGKDIPIGEPEVPYELWLRIKEKLREGTENL